MNTYRKRGAMLCAMCLVAVLAFAGIPEGYYSGANGKKKADLKSAMHDIVRQATVLEYGSGAGKTWSGFYKTDRYNGNQVRDRYSYATFYFSNTTSAVSGMNIEHSFPKSWWGGTNNQAYKDLFNLMPCEAKINSSKSNYAMGVVTDVVTTNGCTKVGKGYTGKGTKNLWEPADEWKGDFARNYFYMVTAYSDLHWESNGLDMLENNEWPTLQKWAYELLLEWNRQDPVDEIEVERNEAVYGIQHNRNPFIDYPNLAEYIWGDSVAYAFDINGTIDGGSFGKPDVQEVIVDDVDFAQGMPAGWGINNVLLPSGMSRVWSQTSDYGMKASAFYAGQRLSAESWLVSPEYDLTEALSAEVEFKHTGQYFGSMKDEATLWIQEDRSGTWQQLPINNYMTGSDWKFVTNVVDLTSHCGHDIQLGFRYTSTTAAAGTWEIRSLTLTAKTGVTTGVEPIDIQPESEADTAYYDLQGRRVLRPMRGIYIYKGKKIFVR